MLVVSKADIVDTFNNICNYSVYNRQNEIVNIETLGSKYKITDHGVVNDSTLLQTEKIQAVIDQASSKGGGVIIIPKGTYLSGALFFKPKTHLYLEEGAV